MTTPTEPYAPLVPKKVRDVAYWTLFVLSAATLLVAGIAPIYATAIVATQILATVGVVTGVSGFIAGGLGVAYRPGASK